jgi:hypothetical protein
VRQQPRQRPGLTHLAGTSGEALGQQGRQRHQLGRLVGGIAIDEDGLLRSRVASNPAGDVEALDEYGEADLDGGGIDRELTLAVPDLAQQVSDRLLEAAPIGRITECLLPDALRAMPQQGARDGSRPQGDIGAANNDVDNATQSGRCENPRIHHLGPDRPARGGPAA